MTVNVEYVTSTRAITNTRKEEVELKEHSTANDLLDKLTAKYGPKFKQTICPNPSTIYVAVEVGGKGFEQLNNLNTGLNNGANIILGMLTFV
jgi:molybdopterin converting factor small subunit